ncbi:MAG: T6SS immunity protein Tli4 family protein [Gammaproteobacteria bacterium]
MLAVAVVLLEQSACSAQEKTMDRAIEPWKLAQAREVRNYVPASPASGMWRECLGRLAFNTSTSLQWALDSSDKVEDYEPPEFVDDLPGDERERLAYGPVDIWVSQPATPEDIETYRRSLDIQDVGAGAESWGQAVAEYQEKLEKAKREPDGPVTLFEEKLENAKNRLTDAQNRKRLDFGLPQSMAYDDGAGQIRVRFLMGGHIFTVLRTHPSLREGDPEREKMLTELRSILSRIRARAPGEVPSELGVCLPYAFIADDGKGDYQAHATFRYADHPGVIYTIDTGLKRPADIAGTAILPTPAPVRVYSYLPATLAPCRLTT